MKGSRYFVGIDLGTTNIAVAYSDRLDTHAGIELFYIDQLIGPRQVDRLPLLPAFRFHPHQSQMTPDDAALPWTAHTQDEGAFFVLGQWAKQMASKTKGQVVHSAKSWLSHEQIDPQADLLPWMGNHDTEKVSPVDAVASYLNHIRNAWNYHHPDQPLERQDLVITIPASFGDKARALTVEAAALAKLTNVRLLEEPQAVCYDWHHRHQTSAAHELANVEMIFVCDIGGGTTDFSLIEPTFEQTLVSGSTDSSQGLSLRRLSVGQHLILGGDNIDMSIGYLAEHKLSGQTKLSANELNRLAQQSRTVKETLLSDPDLSELTMTLLGSGSQLLGKARRVKFSQQELLNVVLDGFFPLTQPNERPASLQNALVQVGLPYVADAAVSKHMAQFLFALSDLSQTKGPNTKNIKEQQSPNFAEKSAVKLAVLFNGGIFNSPVVAARLERLLNSWFEQPVRVLTNHNPDTSVAFGAVAYALAHAHQGVTITGGSARNYFLMLGDKKSDSQAICLLTKGAEENKAFSLKNKSFWLMVGQAVKFHLVCNTSGTWQKKPSLSKQPIGSSAIAPLKPQTITQGMIIDGIDEGFSRLPPFVVEIEAKDIPQAAFAEKKNSIEVRLSCQLTELGTLQIDCISVQSPKIKWRLNFEIRHQESIDEAMVALDEQPHIQGLTSSLALISAVYSGNKSTDARDKIKTLNKTLERALGDKDHWDFVTLRSLADGFLKGKKRRKRSQLHEQQWLRYTGFTLRPGFGDLADPWRLEELWPLYQGHIQHKNAQTYADWWVFWRRVAGGLTQQQQEHILTDIAKYLHPSAFKTPALLKEAEACGYDAMVRLAASLEHLDSEDKAMLLQWFLTKAQHYPMYQQAHWWAIGRLGARVLLYGSQHNIIAKSDIERYLTQLLTMDWGKDQSLGLAMTMLCRKTGQRDIDVDDELTEQVIALLKRHKCPESWVKMITEVTLLTHSESKRMFGDSLPNGLLLKKER